MPRRAVGGRTSVGGRQMQGGQRAFPVFPLEGTGAAGCAGWGWQLGVISAGAGARGCLSTPGTWPWGDAGREVVAWSGTVPQHTGRGGEGGAGPGLAGVHSCSVFWGLASPGRGSPCRGSKARMSKHQQHESRGRS